MSKSLSPFTKAQLLPQEETLEVLRKKGSLFIGIPKETFFQEKRVCLTPDAVSALVYNGHRVMIESGAGEGANFSDNEYSEAGAEISKDSAKVFSCPIILKVEPPSLEEIKLINPNIGDRQGSSHENEDNELSGKNLNKKPGKWKNDVLIDEMESVPAYKRKGVQIDKEKFNDSSNVSRYSLSDVEDGVILRKNSYLHDKVD